MKTIKRARKSYSCSDFLQLSFFAKRFHIPVSHLCWGIIFSGEEGDELLMPAVLVKGTNLYINLYTDALAPLCNIAGSRQITQDAEITEDGNSIIFCAGPSAVQLDKDCFYSLYRTKVFSEQLAEEAEKLN